MIAAALLACRPAAPPSDPLTPLMEDSATGSASCPDADQDRLDDCAEAALGTDPTVQDTDGDGYFDGDEVAVGSDPTDADSRIYAGGWPYHPDKDRLGDPGFGGVAAQGAQIPRFVGTDQFGQAVDLYDFAGAGVPLVLDVSAGWCDPCRDLAGWLAGAPSATFDAVPGWAAVRDDLAAGRISWITILFEDDAVQPAEGPFCAEWAEAFPNDRVAVLADPASQLTDWLFPSAYPNLHLVGADMVLQVYDPFGPGRVLDALSE